MRKIPAKASKYQKFLKAVDDMNKKKERKRRDFVQSNDFAIFRNKIAKNH